MGLSHGWRELVAAAIFASIQCLVLAPRSLRVLWLIPVHVFVWQLPSVVFAFLSWRHGIDAALELVIPFIDNDIVILRLALFVVFQWLVLWHAFRITKWWIVASALGWLVGQTMWMMAVISLPWLGYSIGTALAGLIYGCATAYVFELHLFGRMQASEA
jgi:hypothetical protein